MARPGTIQRFQLNAPSPQFLLSLLAMSMATVEAQTTTPAPASTTGLSTTLATSSRAAISSSAAANNGTATRPFSTWPTYGADGRPFRQDDDDDDDRPRGLVNYYFVFLAIFILLAFLGVYFLNRRRRARKAAFQNSGQDALARDADGWTSNARRWHWRNESRNDRNEGLNELGQAPPAYTAKAQAMEPSAEPAGPASSGPQIPLAALARNERDRDVNKPPEYSEAVRADSAAGSQSEPAPQAQAPPAATPSPAPAPASAPAPAPESTSR